MSLVLVLDSCNAWTIWKFPINLTTSCFIISYFDSKNLVGFTINPIEQFLIMMFWNPLFECIGFLSLLVIGSCDTCKEEWHNYRSSLATKFLPFFLLASVKFMFIVANAITLLHRASHGHLTSTKLFAELIVVLNIMQWDLAQEENFSQDL